MFKLKVFVSGFSMLCKSSRVPVYMSALMFFSLMFGYIFAGPLFNKPPYYDLWCVAGVFSVVIFGFVLLYKSVLTTFDKQAGKIVVDELFVFSRREVLLIDIYSVQGFFVEEGRLFGGLMRGYVLSLVYEASNGEFKVQRLGGELEPYAVKTICDVINEVMYDWKTRDKIVD